MKAYGISLQPLRIPSSRIGAPRPTRTVKLLPLACGTRAALSRSGHATRTSSACPVGHRSLHFSRVPRTFPQYSREKGILRVYTFLHLPCRPATCGLGDTDRMDVATRGRIVNPPWHSGIARVPRESRARFADENCTPMGRVPNLKAYYDWVANVRGRKTQQGAPGARLRAGRVPEHGGGRPTNDRR